MDSITQACLGAAVATAGFRNKLGPKVLGLGMLVATLPDLDIFTHLAGPWATMRYHRGPTHSLLVLPFLAIPIGWLCWQLARKKGSVRTWMHMAFWCLVTHPILDLFTSYGTQLFSPLTNHRFAIDAIAIVDPIYTFFLIAAVFLGLLSNVTEKTKVKSARIALLLCSIYIFIGIGFGETIKSNARSQLSKTGFVSQHLRCIPSLFNNLLWHIVARDSNGNLMVGQACILHKQPIAFYSIPWTKHPLISKALETKEGKLFRWFTKSTLSARLKHHAKGTYISFCDHRYGLTSDPSVSPFGAVSSFDLKGNYLGTKRYRPIRKLKIEDELALTWKYIMEGPPLPLATNGKT